MVLDQQFSPEALGPLSYSLTSYTVFAEKEHRLNLKQGSAACEEGLLGSSEPGVSHPCSFSHQNHMLCA